MRWPVLVATALGAGLLAGCGWVAPGNDVDRVYVITHHCPSCVECYDCYECTACLGTYQDFVYEGFYEAAGSGYFYNGGGGYYAGEGYYDECYDCGEDPYYDDAGWYGDDDDSYDTYGYPEDLGDGLWYYGDGWYYDEYYDEWFTDDGW